MRLERWGVWVAEMDVRPTGYGIAWFDPLSMRAFCVRFPFNRVVSAFRAWYLAWHRPVDDDPILAAFAEGEHRGFLRGERAGYEKGLRHLQILIAEDRRLYP